LQNDVALIMYCCSDRRLCNRSLMECHDSEDMIENHRTETDSVHSDDQAANSDCASTDLAGTDICEQAEEEKTDAGIFDGEFAQDVELMKSMGLPLSFTQASERHQRKKVCRM